MADGVGVIRHASTRGRVPLGDATGRVNNSLPYIPPRGKSCYGSAQSAKPTENAKPAIAGEDRLPPRGQIQYPPQPAVQPPPPASIAAAAAASRSKKHFEPMPERRTTLESKRVSHYPDSDYSSRSKEGYKRFVGPWHLGKTLGKGSSAHVRLCKHRFTSQLAAVKIINKRMASRIPDSSMAALNKLDRSMPDNINGEMRVPVAVEREVAILKLIDHPNIVKLYDIWENRSDIYLVLEFVDAGDLFNFILNYSPLSEQDALFYYRQIMSAIGYCHEFNICHRDLKPENILLTRGGQIKIADFGMAALHQTHDHRLMTFCGSPHYAAPELMRSQQYRGDRADIWSLGVILYALLTMSLPFDDPDQSVMIAKAKKGVYCVPECVSSEAKDLIARMLRLNPARRISVAEMWQHPLVLKYDYLDDLGRNNGRPAGLRNRSELQSSPLMPTQVDAQLLRQLRSMYHMFEDDQLRAQLASNAPNDQKVFYWLLHGYREKQLENFNPELVHSVSDYHHLKPSVWKKQASTCSFLDQRPGQGRSISRFTVISNVAESEAGTVQSYDPFNASRTPLQPRPSQVGRTKVVIHSQEEEAAYVSRMSRRGTGSTATRRKYYGHSTQFGSQRTAGTSGTAARSVRSPPLSFASLPQSTGMSRARNQSYARIAPRKRGFANAPPSRRQSQDQRQRAVLDDASMRAGPSSIAGGDDASSFQLRSPPRPEHGREGRDGRDDRDDAHYRTTGSERATVTLNVIKPKDPHHYIKEEIRHFSSEVAKDLDKAFNSSLIAEDSFTVLDSTRHDATQLSFSLTSDFTVPAPPPPPPSPPPPAAAAAARYPWDDRPLPPLPAGSPAVNLPPPPKHQVVRGRDSKDGLGSRFSIPPRKNHDRRVVSAPPPAAAATAAANQAAVHANSAIAVPAVPFEGSRGGDAVVAGQRGGNELDSPRARIASAPARSATYGANYGTDYFANVDVHGGNTTIRVVDSPTRSPVRAPRPLNVLKKGFAGSGDRAAESLLREFADAYPPEAAADVPAAKKKVSFWFRRSSAAKVGARDAPVGADPDRDDELPRPATAHHFSRHAHSESSSSNATSIPGKKKTFGFLFWKNIAGGGREAPRMSIASREESSSFGPPDFRPVSRVGFRRPASAAANNAGGRGTDLSWSDGGEVRNIEVKQNWLARLFRVKPATSYLCFVISRKRARQEIAIMLREWRQYGMRDIEVDKERNLVFARVGVENYLQLKEVSFAAEIMTVVEHGNRNPLSIVRFTQERGAASSFHKVMETLRMVFESRNLLVSDKYKAKMMVKTLNS